MLSPDEYGIIGSIYATVYLSARLSTFGAPYTIAPFFSLISQSKSSFRAIVVKRFLAGSIGNALIAASIIACGYQGLLKGISSPPSIVVWLLVLVETVRILLRQLLHCSFQSKRTILAEQIPFFGYLGVLWGTCLIFGASFLSAANVFILYLLEASFVLCLLICLTRRWYQKLPDGSSELPIKRIHKAWFFDWTVKGQ